MLKIDSSLTAASLLPAVEKLYGLSAAKVRDIEQTWQPANGSPVFTVGGKYASRGWTEWTQGFQFGSAILQFDATGDAEFLNSARVKVIDLMALHVSHTGVHDHGFNNVSTYGNLRRLMLEGRIPANDWELRFYELALKASGAIQAARWTQLTPDLGYVYSFNGPHSLFSDTIRSMRALVVAHQLGHRLMGEGDESIDLLPRSLQHAAATARYNVYYGTGRDSFDIRGRVVHESIFNLNNRAYRCPSTQQGYSPFTTWTRGQAWILCGYAEQLEFLNAQSDSALAAYGGKRELLQAFEEVVSAVASFWLEHTPTDGIPYWDTGAPNLHRLGDWASRPSDPFNEYEPVDSSAAAIAAQGLLRYGNYLHGAGRQSEGGRYRKAALTIARHLFAEPYLSTDPAHQGLILHSIYHQPNGWDHKQPGRKVASGESSMWGDYHARELGLMIQREAKAQPYYKFF
ncbi:MAG: glycosyl hydrolase [Bryobacteraceae bacterium]|jgi:unsaturated chondroitin disaccharide hydrolase